MPDWNSFQNFRDLREHMTGITTRIRNKTLDIGRPHYALGLAVGVIEAIHCGHTQIAAVEMGVAHGNGLLDLCQAAEFFAKEYGLDIKVYGFDRGEGLPPPADFRDHPEIWRQSQYFMGDPEVLRAKLPAHATLILGEVAQTASTLRAELGERRLAFVSIDVDFYSSAMDCFEILKFDRECYMPALPMYFDDMDNFLTYNRWCGEEAAIQDFNAANEKRKIQRQSGNFRIKQFHVCHVLDHPMRTGEQETRPNFPMLIGTI